MFAAIRNHFLKLDVNEKKVEYVAGLKWPVYSYHRK